MNSRAHPDDMDASTQHHTLVSGWLTLPRWVYRHRCYSGYFEDMGTYPGHTAERERKTASRMRRLGIEWEEKFRPERWIEQCEEHWRGTFGDSTPEDAFRAMGDDAQEPDTEELRADAIGRMAEGLVRSWRTSADVRAALPEQSETAKADAAAVGLCMALGRYDDPQRIRFGNRYVVTPPELSPVDVRPVTQLSFGPFMRWLHRQAIAEAEAHLLGEPPQHTAGPSPETVSIEHALLLEDVTAGRVEEMIFSTLTLGSILAATSLSPAEKELVDAYRETADWPEAARFLDISLPAMRWRKRQVLRKLAPP